MGGGGENKKISITDTKSLANELGNIEKADQIFDIIEKEKGTIHSNYPVRYMYVTSV